MKKKNASKNVRHFQDLKLASKTSIVIGVILLLSLSALVLVSAITANVKLRNSIYEEFSGIATKNGMMVQSMLDTAATTAQNLQDYMQRAYEEASDGKGAAAKDVEKLRSSVYPKDILARNRQIEDYILNMSWSVVHNNPDIMAMGAFFEPYAFDPGIKDYTLYVTLNDAANRTAQSYGSYDKYSKEAYYAEAASSQKPVFTDPYQDQGVNMITAAFPILWSGKTQGVIIVDINVDNFAKMQTTHPKYTTMFADICTDDATLVYDTISPEYVGQSFADMLGKDFDKINAEMQKGEPFNVETIRSDTGYMVTRYFYPLHAGDEVWWSMTALSNADLTQDAIQLTILMVVMSVIALVLIVVVVMLMGE